MSEMSYIGGIPETIFTGEALLRQPIRSRSGDIFMVTCLADKVDIEPEYWDGECEPHFGSSLRFLREGTTMSFSIETKNRYTDDVLHPDLNASKLLARTIDYFDAKTGGVDRVETTWRDDSVNYFMFQQALKRMHCKDIDVAWRSAAAATWTARNIALKGFVKLEYIRETTSSTGTFIDGMFYR